MKFKLRVAAAASVLAASFAIGVPAAQAQGCNGVVNWFTWGCAPWDNNNGPRFPYYSKKVVTMRAPQGSRIETKNGMSMININGTSYPVSGVVAAGGANVVAAGGANVRVIVQN